MYWSDRPVVYTPVQAGWGVVGHCVWSWVPARSVLPGLSEVAARQCLSAARCSRRLLRTTQFTAFVHQVRLTFSLTAIHWCLQWLCVFKAKAKDLQKKTRPRSRPLSWDQGHGHARGAFRTKPSTWGHITAAVFCDIFWSSITAAGLF